MRFGVLHHAVNLFLGKCRATSDGHLLLFTGSKILSRDVHDSVGVDVEGDFDLRNSSWRWRNPSEFEHAQALVVRGHFALALEDQNLHAWLIVISSSEDFRTLRWDRGVALDELGHDSTLGFDTK